MPRRPRRHALVALVALAPAALAAGQSGPPAAFVANNGNLEGSVSSFTLDTGVPTLVQTLILGVDDQPTTNAQAISLTPDGRYLAIGHGTISSTVEALTLVRVHEDATMTIAAVRETPDSPIDVQWLDDRTLLATRTNTSPCRLVVYRFDDEDLSLTQIDEEPAGIFTTSVALWGNDAGPDVLFAQDSSGSRFLAYAVAGDGTLDPLDQWSTGGLLALGVGVSPDGRAVYAGAGITGGDVVVAARFDPDAGTFSMMPGSPFDSPGDSPKQVAVSADGRHAIVAHGTDSTVRVFPIDARTGQLGTQTDVFDVGFQGSLGQVEVLGDLVLFTDRDTIFDGQRGLYVFRLSEAGTLEPVAPLIDTGGISPWAIATWPGEGACSGDLDGDGVIATPDLLALLADWGTCGSPCPADLDGDGAVGATDLLALFAGWDGCIE